MKNISIHECTQVSAGAGDYAFTLSFDEGLTPQCISAITLTLTDSLSGLYWNNDLIEKSCGYYSKNQNKWVYQEELTKKVHFEYIYIG